MVIKSVEFIKSIEFKNLNVCFEGEESVFDKMNYHFDLTHNLRVDGDTGIGKSLLLKLLSGLIVPMSGDYLINEQAVQNMSFEEFTPYRLGMGYSFEFGGLMHNRTLLENIILTAQYHANYFKFDAEERALDLMKRAGIYKNAHLRPSMIPGSHRKMTVLLRAFLTQPQILLLDEPAAGLSQQDIKFIVQLIEEGKKAGHLKCVIFVTQQKEMAQMLTEKVIYIKDKKIFNPADARFQEAS